MKVCTFLLAALFLFAGGVGGTEAVRTVLLISGVVCLAACLSGTAAQNFKTAAMVGGALGPIGFDVHLPLALIASEWLRNALSILLLLGLPWAIYRSIIGQSRNNG